MCGARWVLGIFMELAGHLEKGWLETELTSRRPVLREGPFSSTLREQLWEAS